MFSGMNKKDIEMSMNSYEIILLRKSNFFRENQPLGQNHSISQKITYLVNVALTTVILKMNLYLKSDFCEKI